MVGPNGAGKTTTAAMIAGLVAPSSGQVVITVPRGGRAARAKIGAVIEGASFYPFLTGRENLRTLELAAGRRGGSRADALLTKVGLADAADRPFRAYSLGMRQRLAIAAAVLDDPDLVILDEPTNGLDPAGQREIRALIPGLAAEGRAVLVTSHQLADVQDVCTRVLVIKAGRALAFAPIAELRQGEVVEIQTADPGRTAAVAREAPFVRGVTVRGTTLLVDTGREHVAALLRLLAANGLFPDAIAPRRRTLEEAFFALTEASGERVA